VKLYLLVTQDEFELPLAVADTQTELARMVGVSHRTIASTLCKYRKGEYKSARFREVEVEDE
jgi:hypothetical protein